MSETAPDFGFDSKLVIKWLGTFDIPKSTARNNTKALREAIDDKRDAKILELHKGGHTLRDIEETTGVKKDTANRILKAVANEPVAQTRQDETPDYQTSPEDLPFDEDELDTTPAYNPADDDELKFKSDKVTTIPQTEAFKNELSRHALTAIAGQNKPVAQNDQEDDRPSDAEML